MINLLMEDKRTLREVMDDISKHAREQGLTPEILKQQDIHPKGYTIRLRLSTNCGRSYVERLGEPVLY